jgi:hypothetical protein
MRVPMRSRIGLQTASATAYSRVEGASVPATRFVLDNALLSPTSIAALLVASDVVLRDVGAAGQEFFNNALRAAIGVEADEFLFSRIADGSTTILSVPPSFTASDVLGMFGEALAIIRPANTGSRLFWIAAQDVGHTPATSRRTRDSGHFPKSDLTAASSLVGHCS